MRAPLVVMIVLAACGTRSEVAPVDATAVDAGRSDARTEDARTEDAARADASEPGIDGSVPDAGRCEERLEGRLAGRTPLGDVDLSVSAVVTADCCYNGSAWIRAEGGGVTGELTLRYDAACDRPDGRHLVASSIAPEGALRLERGTERWSGMVTVRAVVVEWREGAAGHALDVTLTVEAPDLALEPFTVRGTYCEWLALTC